MYDKQLNTSKMIGKCVNRTGVWLFMPEREPGYLTRLISVYIAGRWQSPFCDAVIRYLHHLSLRDHTAHLIFTSTALAAACDKRIVCGHSYAHIHWRRPTGATTIRCNETHTSNHHPLTTVADSGLSAYFFDHFLNLPGLLKIRNAAIFELFLAFGTWCTGN